MHPEHHTFAHPLLSFSRMERKGFHLRGWLGVAPAGSAWGRQVGEGAAGRDVSRPHFAVVQ